MHVVGYGRPMGRTELDLTMRSHRPTGRTRRNYVDDYRDGPSGAIPM